LSCKSVKTFDHGIGMYVLLIRQSPRTKDQSISLLIKFRWPQTNLINKIPEDVFSPWELDLSV